MKSTLMITQAKLEWACKRGMLECELFLVPFLKNQFGSLSNDERSQLHDLLEYPDPVLYGWFMGTLPVTGEMVVFKNLIEKIRCHPRA